MKNKRLITRKLRYVFYTLLTCVLCAGCKNKGCAYSDISFPVGDAEFTINDSMDLTKIRTINIHELIDTSKPVGMIGNYQNTIGSEQFLRRVKRDSILRAGNAR